jgi:hypothetical protein
MLCDVFDRQAGTCSIQFMVDSTMTLAVRKVSTFSNCFSAPLCPMLLWYLYCSTSPHPIACGIASLDLPPVSITWHVMRSRKAEY